MTANVPPGVRPGLARVALVVLCLPALAGAGAVLLGEGQSFWRSGVPDLSLPDAIRNSELDAVAWHLRDGRDPGAPIAITDETLTGGRTVEVPPLLIAVASNKEDSVTMLLGAGARLSPHELALARCLSVRLDRPAMAALLDRYAGSADPSTPCPGASEAMRTAPLVWFGETRSAAAQGPAEAP